MSLFVMLLLLLLLLLCNRLFDCLIVCLFVCFFDLLRSYHVILDWARGRGARAPGPKLQDTHGECNYLLSGRLPTVRQTTYCQANYLLSKLEAVTHGESNDLLSGRLPTVRQATYCQTG